MGTEIFRPCVQEENMDVPSIPPGFESFTAVTLKRVEAKEIIIACPAFGNASESQSAQNKTKLESGDDAKISRSLRHRPSVDYSKFDDNFDIEADSKHNLPLRPSLPKGIIRGCIECSNCQKVTAQWHPEEACRPDLEDVPVFYPSEVEFEDTLNYIATIRPRAEKYGICRIVPPPSWKPPCPLKEKNMWERSKFLTRIQRIDKLQNRDSVKRTLKVNSNKRRKRRRCMKTAVEYTSSTGDVSGQAGIYEAQRFGFEPGLEFTLDTFQKYADDFKAQYFRKNESIADQDGNLAKVQEQFEPSVRDIEGEYWRIVEKPTEEIEVLYGADIETGVFGSGFPKLSDQGDSDSDVKYVKSGWNLNNFPRLPGSVLSYESSDISGVLVPWLYIGMCFSSFCWHVEDHHLYSLNYMHWGAPKLWYGVPGEDALKLEAAMKKHLPELFEEQPDLLHKLVTQLSPSILRSEGVPVYRCVQYSGEFVLTFPRAYHSGFNCGFNCAEAVNVAPVDWLPHGQNAIELYCEQGRKTSISHDKLLLGAAREAVKAHWELNLLRKNTSDNLRWKSVCGKNGILFKAFKDRVEMEQVRRGFLCSSSHVVKMETDFDSTIERECVVCLFDLHLSAAGCPCSPDRYACLNHANQLCLCSWQSKMFLIRYDIKELNILVEALEGKLSAIYRWARLDFGLALNSYISRGNVQIPGLIDKLSHSSEGIKARESISQTSINCLGKMERKEKVGETLNPARNIDGLCFLWKEKPSQAASDLDRVNALCQSPSLIHEVKMENVGSEIKKEETSHLTDSLSNPVCQFSQEGTSYTDNLAADKSEVWKSSYTGTSDIILLSDDEDDESNGPFPKRAKESPKMHTEHCEMLIGSSNIASSSNCTEDPPLTTPSTCGAVKGELDENLSPDWDGDGDGNSGSSNSVNVNNQARSQDHEKYEIPLQSRVSELSCTKVTSSVNSLRNAENLLAKCETGICDMTNVGSSCQLPQPCGTELLNNEDSSSKMGPNANSRLPDNVPTALGNQPNTQNNLDRYFRQKGPRIAKVIRRINCNVEPLEYGAVQPGNLWCDSRAIFPKGFRSRVRYISVLDPTNMCYYVSEILDAGHGTPLFMVSSEESPSEVFIHVSTAKCWEMVRERVNQEITRQHKLGRMKLPPLQPPGSLDGLEMFGFSSPAIVQVIQAMDRSRVCTEYWKSRPLLQIPQHCQPEENNGKTTNNQDTTETSLSHGGADTVLHGLFKKANLEELHALNSILIDTRPATSRGMLTKLLQEEIQKRRR